MDFIHLEVNAAYEALTGTTNPVGKKMSAFFPEYARSNKGRPRNRLITEQALDIANSLVAKDIIPAKVAEDALHIAIATVNGVDYLLTVELLAHCKPGDTKRYRCSPRRYWLIVAIYLHPRRTTWRRRC